MTPACLEIRLKKVIASCNTTEQLTSCQNWFFRIHNNLEKLTGNSGMAWSEVVDDQRLALLNNHSLEWKDMIII